MIIKKISQQCISTWIELHYYKHCNTDTDTCPQSVYITTATTTKPFVPSIWGRLHEPKENYAGSGTWISFLHSFLSSNMPSLRPLASISCRITSIHVFFGLPYALLTCPKLIRSTRRTGASVGLRRTWPNHRRRFSLIFSFIEATPILVRISSFLTLSLWVLPHI